MKRHKSLILISQDHYHGLQLAQLIKKNAPELKNLPSDIEGKKDYTINFYENDLLHHFYLEESIILPAVKGKDEEIDNLFDDMVQNLSWRFFTPLRFVQNDKSNIHKMVLCFHSFAMFFMDEKPAAYFPDIYFFKIFPVCFCPYMH